MPGSTGTPAATSTPTSTPTLPPTSVARAAATATPPAPRNPALLALEDRPVSVSRAGESRSVYRPRTVRTADGREAAAGRVLVRYHQDTDGAARARVHQAIAAQGVTLLQGAGLQGAGTTSTEVVALDPSASLDDAIARYRADPRVRSAEPDYVLRALGTPNDPAFASQWNLVRIDAPAAWNVTHGSGAVTVAILDCGIYEAGSTSVGPGHADVNGKVTARANFSNSPDADDFCNHGTHVAGIVAANTNNGVGIAGVGYDTRLLNAKILNDDGAGLLSWGISGIEWAVANGARVINLSVGASGACPGALQDAINAAWAANVVVVAAAGNVAGAPGFPANCDNVLAVAATDAADARASFTSYGTSVDLAAPGVGIYSTDFVGRYSTFSGTSQAAPHVSGVAALLWASGLSSAQSVVDRITAGADPISGTGTYWRYGRLNAARALGVPATATPTSTATLPPAPASATPTATATATATATRTPTATLGPITATVRPAAGGRLASDDGSLVLAVPPGAVTADTAFTMAPANWPPTPTPGGTPPSLAGLRSVGHVFSLTADSNGTPVAAFGTTLTITAGYEDEAALDPATLAIYYFDGNSQSWAPLPSRVNAGSHSVTGTTDHFTVFGVLAAPPSPTPTATATPAPAATAAPPAPAGSGAGDGGGASSPANDAPASGGSSASSPSSSAGSSGAATPAGTAVTPSAASASAWVPTGDGRVTIAPPGGAAPLTVAAGSVPYQPNEWCGRERVYLDHVRLEDIGIAGATFGIATAGTGGVYLDWIPPEHAACVDWSRMDASRNFGKETIMQARLLRPLPGALLWVLDGDAGWQGRLYEVGADGTARYVSGAYWQAHQEHFREVWKNVMPVSWMQMVDFAGRGLVGADL